MPNRDNTRDLHRLVDGLFEQLQERMTKGVRGPATFKVYFTELADYFNRAPGRAALKTLQTFGVPTGTSFSSYLRAFGVAVSSTIEKGCHLCKNVDRTGYIPLVQFRL